MKKRIAQIFFIILLVLTRLTPALADAPSTSAKEEETLFMAEKAFEDGFYDVSLGLLARFLKNYPDSVKAIEANLLVGECFFHQNKFTKALVQFELLLKDAQAQKIKDALYYWIAEVNFKGNNYNQAVAYYKKIIGEFPASSYAPIAYYSLGWCLFQERKFKDALEYFKALAEKYPQEPQGKDAAFKLIECLYNLKDYAALKEKINPAVRALSKDTLRMAYLYFYLGEANYYLGNFNEAIDAYSKVLANNPEAKMQALAKLDLGWSYLKLKRYQEAEDTFLAIKQEDLERRNRDILLLGRVTVLMETNRINQARKLYEELLSLTNDPLIRAQAAIGKAEALYNLADYAEASKAYREALAKINFKDLAGPAIDKLYYNLGCSWLKLGDPVEAINAFQKIIDLNNDAAFKLSALCQIGDAYQEEANYRKAQETYALLLKEYPDSPDSDYALYQLGSVCLKDSKIEEAIADLTALGEKFPASKFLDDAAYTLGLVYFKKQDYHSAKAVLKKFQAEFKDSDLKPKALYLLGNCFYSSGDYAQAMQIFKEIPGFSGLDAELIQKAEYGAADSLYQMGQEQEALARFKALRAKYPDASVTPDIVWWLGSYYYQHNELDLAARYFLSLIRDFPKSYLLADAYYALGLTLMDESKTQEALDNLKHALNLNKPDIQSKATVALAELFFKAGDYNNALEYYHQGLESSSLEDAPKLHLKIAEIEEAKGDLDEAIKEYREVSESSVQDASLTVTSLLRLGRIYEDKNNIQEALKTYSRILEMKLPESKYAEERIARLKAKVN